MVKRILCVIEAYCCLLRWDRFMKRRSFSDLYHAVRAQPVAQRCSKVSDVDRIYGAVEVACALYPKQVLCLQRSCVLTRMLRNRGYAARLVIGSQRNPFRAHAWVTLDAKILGDKLAQRGSFLIMEVC